MASIKSSSFLDGESIPILYVPSKDRIDGKTLGKDFVIEYGYTASSFNTMSVGSGVVLTVNGNLEVISI